VVARIVVGVNVQVFCPFELRELVKSFPGRRWDTNRKCWTVPLAHVDALADALRAAGQTVWVTRTDGSAYTGGGRSHGHRDRPAPSWAEALFDAVGPARSEQVFRALTRVLHPDVGGDHALMTALSAARDGRRSIA
jgi:hypothetical protein